MKCAYSLSSVLILLIVAICISCIVIWATEGNKDICPDTSLKCLEDGSCIAKKRFCNEQRDCPNGSDEELSRCGDSTAFNDFLDRFLPETPANITLEKVHKVPIGCNVYKEYGIVCKNRTTWKELPLDEFDINAKILDLKQVIETDELMTQYEFDLEKSPHEFRTVYFEGNKINSLGDDSFQHMKHLKRLHLYNNSIEYIAPGAFYGMTDLTWLNLSCNNLNLTNYRFPELPSLDTLSMKQNKIEDISDHIFRELGGVVILYLQHNQIISIGARAFRYNLNLTTLDLSNNRIQNFEPLTFVGQMKLQSLQIGFNKFRKLPKHLFDNMKSLRALYLEEIEIDVIEVGLFLNTPKLDYILFNKFQYCIYAPNASRCYPLSDGSSSLNELLRKMPPRYAVWIMATLTLFANIGILATRCGGPCKKRGSTTVVDILITNLAAADFLMGVYLIVFAFKDAQYRNTYITHAYEWSTSTLCTTIGVLAMISTEVSLLILTLMSVERYIVIGRPFQLDYKLRKTQARCAVAVIWILSCILALVPVIHWSGQYLFYGSTGLCFQMHLDDPFPFGWQYTTFVFIGLNSFCLSVIIVAYGSMFWEMRKSRVIFPNPVVARDMEMAIRLFLTVGTNFLCWTTIIVLKIMVLSGYQLHDELISWVNILVLPLNSALNPFFYTFSFGEYRVRFLEMFRIHSNNPEPVRIEMTNIRRRAVAEGMDNMSDQAVQMDATTTATATTSAECRDEIVAAGISTHKSFTKRHHKYMYSSGVDVRRKLRWV